MTGRIRAVVVDDEPLARERIRALLEAEPAVEVVAECGDGGAAINAVSRHRPDLLFLDIQMPEMDGFEVLEALDPDRLPAVVFVTAYDEYALRAFDVHAVDYVLKPIDPDRFRTAVARARGRMVRPEGSDRGVAALLDALRAERRGPVRFVVRNGERLGFVRADEIDWIESDGNYAKLHAAGRVHVMRATLKAVEHRLDPETFVRIHRSFIVNLDRVTTVEPYFHGEYVVIMKDGTKLTSSRSHSAALRARLR
jgi:two-component system LytT family response regulator